MFERNPIDNLNATAIAVEVKLDDGSTLAGRAALDKGRSIHHLMAGDDPFLFVELSNGDADFVPKGAIKGLKIVRPIVPQPLRQPTAADRDTDPARVLGVAPDAPWDVIKTSYHRLVKLYHPDRYAGIELPPEVAEYIDGKARQINQAFRRLKTQRASEQNAF